MLILVSYVCLKGDSVDNDASPIASPIGDTVPLSLVHQLSLGRALRRPAWRALLPMPRSSPSSAVLRPAGDTPPPSLAPCRHGHECSCPRLTPSPSSARACCGRPAAHTSACCSSPAWRGSAPDRASLLAVHAQRELCCRPRGAIDVLAHPGPLKASHPPPTPLPASQPPPPLQSGLAGLPRM